MHGLNTIVSLNSEKHNGKPVTQRGTLTAKDIAQKSKSKQAYMARAKIIATAVFCSVIAFGVGVYNNDANTYAASAIANVTPQDQIELMQGTINRLEREKAALGAEFVDNIRVIPFEYDDCMAMFLDFYKEYPSYHIEDESGSIVIDYRIQNPEEEATQYCSFIIDDFAATHRQSK